MKWLLTITMLCGLAFGQALSPNLNMPLPPPGTQNWGYVVNNNFLILDTTYPSSDCGVSDQVHALAWNFTTKNMFCNPISGGGGGGSFANVTSGTNAFTLLMGTGGSLGVTGTGTINSTSLLGKTWASPAAIGNTTPNTGVFTGLTISSISGSVQCLHVNTSGFISGTGADCGSGGGGGGVTSVSGTANQITVVNGSTSPVISIPSPFTFPGTVTNNLSIFGSTTSLQLQGVISDETGTGQLVFGTGPAIDLTNGTGLPISTGVSGLGTGVATFLAIPTSANLHSAVTDPSGNGQAVFSTPPTTNCNWVFTSNVTASTAVPPAWGCPGVPVDATNPATLPATDRASYINWTSGSALALPAISGLFTANFPFVLKNTSGTDLIVTPNAGAGDLCNGGVTCTVSNNYAAWFYQDSTSAPGHWFKIDVPTFAAAVLKGVAGIKLGNRVYDGVMAPLVTGGNSTSPTTLTYTTNFNNEVVVTMESWGGNNTLSGVAGGLSSISWAATPTPGAGKFTPAVYTQSVTTAGSTSTAMGGTLSGTTGWTGITFALAPSGTISARQGRATQNTGATSITVANITGITVGDFLVKCVTGGTGSSNFLSQSDAGWQVFKYNFNGAGTTETLCWAKVATSADVSAPNFNFAQTVSGPITGWALAFVNVLYPDELLTSATANFKAADIGKLLSVGSLQQTGGDVISNVGTAVTHISGPSFFTSLNNTWINMGGTFYQVASVTGGTTLTLVSAPANNTYNAVIPPFPQGDGIIGSFVNGGVIGFGIWNTHVSAANFDVAYGADNSTPLQTAITNAATTGALYLPPGVIMYSTPLASTAEVPITIKGAGSGNVYSPFYGGIGIGFAQPWIGTNLIFAASVSTAAALQMNVANFLHDRVNLHFSDFSLIGGAGRSSDGGGYSGFIGGLRLNGSTGALLQNLNISNFNGDNVLIKGSPVSQFTDQITIENSQFYDSNLYNLEIDCTTAGCQNITLINNKIDIAGSAPVHLNATGSVIWSLVMMGNDISPGAQIPGDGAAISVDASATSFPGCEMLGNYFEWDGVANIQLNTNNTVFPCQWGSSTFVMPATGRFVNSTPTFSGTATCSTLGTQLGGPKFAIASPSSWNGPYTGSAVCSSTTSVTAVTFVISSLPTVANGWNCYGSDQTLGVAAARIGNSTTQCTLNLPSMTANDVINYTVTPY